MMLYFLNFYYCIIMILYYFCIIFRLEIMDVFNKFQFIKLKINFIWNVIVVGLRNFVHSMHNYTMIKKLFLHTFTAILPKVM